MSYLVPDVKGVKALSVVPPCFSGTEMTMEAADNTQMKSLSLIIKLTVSMVWCIIPDATVLSAELGFAELSPETPIILMFEVCST